MEIDKKLWKQTITKEVLDVKKLDLSDEEVREQVIIAFYALLDGKYRKVEIIKSIKNYKLIGSLTEEKEVK